ncbi:MAG: alanyl-tRNA editing protein, partial [Bryobacteraceae bacterium]
YYADSYLKAFQARIVDRADDGRRVYLDRTAFYPTSGGQLFDTGEIGGAAVVDVVDEGERIAHLLTNPPAGDVVDCRIHWQRRFDHMQQHSGQHLLSAVLSEMHGLTTVSVHLGEESSTVDVDAASVSAGQLRSTEERSNALVAENRPVDVSCSEASEGLGLRKASERTGVLRIVTMQGLDRSACGGTHVRSTGEIGPVQLRKVEKIRNTVRIEFLCGMRAVRRARADFDALSRIAQLYSSALDEAPALVASQLEAARGAEKLRQRLEADLARYQGAELYSATPPDVDGVRRASRRAASMDDLRLLAQSFCAHTKAVFAGWVAKPPSVILVTSADSGVDAGKVMKAVLAKAGGRGGGSARMAQGSLPADASFESVLGSLLESTQ